jgi:pilus assembly protein CpaB
MRVLIVGIVVLALAVAGVATYLIRSFSGEEKVAELKKEAQKPKLRVLIATKKMKPGDILKADAMAWQVWVEEALNAQFVSVSKDEDEPKKMQEMTGQIVRAPIQIGEPILASKLFKRDKAGLLSGVLDGGMRAVSFSVSPETASAGFILPGDRVDVLLTHSKAQEAMQKKAKPGGPDPNAPLLVLQQTTETILRGVRVIAVNQATNPPPDNAVAVVATTITLELTPKQSEVLITARAMGRLSLVLRSLQEGEDDTKRRAFTTDVEVSPFLSNINEILAEAEMRRDRQLDKKDKADGKVAAPRKPKETVKIFRGGKGGLSEVTSQ